MRADKQWSGQVCARVVVDFTLSAMLTGARSPAVVRELKPKAAGKVDGRWRGLSLNLNIDFTIRMEYY